MKPKILIMCLIACVLALSSGVLVKQADADAILFPWIVKSATISTIISVVNTAGLAPEMIGTPQLHWQYFYKDPNNEHTTPCTHIDFKMETSKNDIVTVDAAGIITKGLPMFNDPNNALLGVATGALSVPGDRRGFLIVDNNTPLLVDAGTNDDGTLYGEAFIIDLITGLSWGYTAYNARGGGVAEGQNDQVYFTDGMDYQGEVIGPDEKGWTVFLPPSLFTTRFFVTPIGLSGQRLGDVNARVQLCVRPSASGSGCDLAGFFVNDESPISSLVGPNVVCTAALNLSDMMSAAAFTTLNSSGSQGWSYIKTSTGTSTNSSHKTDEVTIGKLEFNISPVTIPPGSGGCSLCKGFCFASCYQQSPKNKNCIQFCNDQCKNKCITPVTIPPSSDFKWIRSSESLPSPLP